MSLIAPLILSPAIQVCKSWALAIDSRRTSVFVSSIPIESDGTESSNDRPMGPGALGHFLCKLPSLEALHFAPSFRKTNLELKVTIPPTTPSSLGEDRRVRTREWVKGGFSEEDGETQVLRAASDETFDIASGSRRVGDEIEEREAQEDAHRRDRAKAGGAAGRTLGESSSRIRTLRELEQLRIDAACAALQHVEVSKICLPCCLLSPGQLRAFLTAIAHTAPPARPPPLPPPGGSDLAGGGGEAGRAGGHALGGHALGGGGERGNGLRVLTSLDVSGNWFKVEGAKVTAQALAHSLSTVTELDLSSNDVTEEGIELLAAALRSPAAARLHRLTLGYSNYAAGHRAPAALADLIRCRHADVC